MAKRGCSSHRLLAPVPLPLLSQHHSTGRSSPKRYDERYGGGSKTIFARTSDHGNAVIALKDVEVERNHISTLSSTRMIALPPDRGASRVSAPGTLGNPTHRRGDRVESPPDQGVVPDVLVLSPLPVGVHADYPRLHFPFSIEVRGYVSDRALPLPILGPVEAQGHH